jgi:DNA polymerase III alpha subunit
VTDGISIEETWSGRADAMPALALTDAGNLFGMVVLARPGRPA